MKNTILCLLTLFTVSFVNAQEVQGKVEYFSKRIKTDHGLTDDEVKSKREEEINAAFEDAYKRASESKYDLTFNKYEALYEKVKELEKPKVSTNGLVIDVAFSSEGKKYLNLKSKIGIVEELDNYDREIIVIDSLVNNKWKLLNESKYIGNYQCFKAQMTIPVAEIKNNERSSLVMKEESKDVTITAWYAPEIPVSFGPKNYWGLPGLILELNDGEMIILCTKVALSSKEKVVIKAPNSSRSMSREEFRIMLIEKMRDRSNISVNISKQ